MFVTLLRKCLPLMLVFCLALMQQGCNGLPLASQPSSDTFPDATATPLPPQTATQLHDALRDAGAEVTPIEHGESIHLNQLYIEERATIHHWTVNGYSLDSYEFDSTEAAAKAASSVEPGGTSLRYQRDDGEVVHRFFNANAGANISWWYVGPLVVMFRGIPQGHDPTAALLGQILQSAPLNYSLDNNMLYLRFYNQSGQYLRELTMNVADSDKSIEIGDLPLWAQSGYHPIEPDTLSVHLTAKGSEREQHEASLDLTPLMSPASNQYTVMLEVVDGDLYASYFSDELFVSEELGGLVYWRDAILENGERIIPQTQGDLPHIRLSSLPDVRNPGLSLMGYNGCSPIGSTYHLNHSAGPSKTRQIIVNRVSVDYVGCNKTLMEQAQLFNRLLEGASYYTINDNILTLTSPTGEQLNFSNSPPQR